MELGGGWQGELTDAPADSGANLSARVVPAGGPAAAGADPPWGYSVTALAELGHDGLDLPHSALVAEMVVLPGDRVAPVAALDPETEPAAAVHVADGVDPALLGSGITLAVLDRPWRLDPGTLALAVAESERPRSGIVVLTDQSAGWYRLPPGSPGTSPEDPILLVAAGGAGLDLRDLGELFGVVVVDGAGLRLDGTRVHGAVVVSEEVDLGLTGQVLWSSFLYRWATDRSVRRVRLVPGSRVEALYP